MCSITRKSLYEYYGYLTLLKKNIASTFLKMAGKNNFLVNATIIFLYITDIQRCYNSITFGNKNRFITSILDC